jgi:hypothetical protein
MTTTLKRPGLASAMAPITLALLLTVGDARADITITFTEDSPNVVETASGAINLTGLRGPYYFAEDGASNPSFRGTDVYITANYLIIYIS